MVQRSCHFRSNEFAFRFVFTFGFEGAIVGLCVSILPKTLQHPRGALSVALGRLALFVK